jgi:hypothetical protein
MEVLAIFCLFELAGQQYQNRDRRASMLGPIERFFVPSALDKVSMAAGETSPRVKHPERHALHCLSGATVSAPPRQASNDVAAPGPSWLTRLFPNVKPYPPGKGDADGLSRNIEDCNKGCIGITPR